MGKSGNLEEILQQELFEGIVEKLNETDMDLDELDGDAIADLINNYYSLGGRYVGFWRYGKDDSHYYIPYDTRKMLRTELSKQEKNATHTESLTNAGIQINSVIASIVENPNDYDLVKSGIEQSGMYLKYAGDILKDNKELVIMAVKNNGNAIKFASERLKRDPDVIRTALEQGKAFFDKLKKYQEVRRKI